MSSTYNTVILISIALLFLFILYKYFKTKAWQPLIAKLLLLVLIVWFLNTYLNFPTTLTARSGEQVNMMILLYVFMLLGMAASYGYTYYSKPKGQRAEFDFGLFILPVLISPIVFLPLLATLQNANLDLSQLDAARFMIFIVAFENGFFWREFFEKRKKDQ